MAGYTSMYGQHYPFEALLLVPHHENDHPRLLIEVERDVLQCMYLWVQSGLKVYCGKNIVNDCPVLRRGLVDCTDVQISYLIAQASGLHG